MAARLPRLEMGMVACIRRLCGDLVRSACQTPSP